MFGRFLDLQKEFDNALDTDIQLIFVTVDPEVDTPERLKQYTETMGGQWLFLTEELDIMREIWDTFHVYVEKEGTLVGHSNLTYLIDELGLIQVRYSGLPPTSAFAADIRKLQEQSP
jgi:protein SCO1/2